MFVSGGPHPELGTALKVMHALGVKLSATLVAQSSGKGFRVNPVISVRRPKHATESRESEPILHCCTHAYI